ncbi:CobW family GTP-binding protein [Streptomyces sp. H27-D2]|uniref:CobW family GTP-binding protein n=1 Tax=Streptomyces sp. H27-D2 TaxID=3046304 RepID=UPI002DBC87AA|nr:GTP-binding protein [Streptomyces sp. H27-D2]MEC4018219.1 GTP-binding protein [Streptomyces sp. H27-D2]
MTDRSGRSDGPGRPDRSDQPDQPDQPDRDALPVVLVGGLHAEARKAAVERLLRAVPGSVALHHDLATAADGTVLRTVRDRDGVTATGDAPLVNDCACCALREDLVPELERLADSGLCRLAVVELWDSVEPQAMAEVVANCGSDALRVSNVLTAVDPALLVPYLSCGDDLAEVGLAAAATDQRTVADTWARQLEYAPVLVLVPGEESDPADLELLEQLHPTARRVAVDSGELAEAAFAGFAGFDVEAAAARQHPACALLPQEADAYGVATLVWHRTRPFHPGRLYTALEDVSCAAARSRGRFWLADRPDTLLSWDAAGGALCVENSGPWLASLPEAAWELEPPTRTVAAAMDWDPEHGDRAQHLTFTSPGLDREALVALLDSCLLTDAEYAAGREEWRLLSTAFDELLDPVS